MNDDVIQVPEMNVRSIVSENAFQLEINLLALFLVQFATPFINERIDLCIHVIATVRALRRKACGMKDVLENVRVFVSADPAQGIDLERAFDHIGIKRAKLK